MSVEGGDSGMHLAAHRCAVLKGGAAATTLSTPPGLPTPPHRTTHALKMASMVRV